MQETPKLTPKRLLVITFKYILPVLLFTAAGSVITIVVARKRPEVLGLTVKSEQKQENRTNEVDALIKEVSTLMSVPTDEQPTVATVTDKEKLPSQPIFIKAANGDKVIIYSNAKRVILYRPGEKRIVDVGTLSAASTVATGSAELVPAQITTKFTLLNGSITPNITKTFQDELTTKYVNLEVIGRVAAAKTDYTETLIVDLTGTNTELVKKIATEMQLTLTDWPESEKKPVGSDIAVIVGSSWAQK